MDLSTTPPPQPDPDGEENPFKLQYSVRALLILSTVVGVVLVVVPALGVNAREVAYLAILALYVVLVVVLLHGAVYAPGQARQFCRGALVGCLIHWWTHQIAFGTVGGNLLITLGCPLVGGGAAVVVGRIWPVEQAHQRGGTKKEE